MKRALELQKLVKKIVYQWLLAQNYTVKHAVRYIQRSI